MNSRHEHAVVAETIRHTRTKATQHPIAETMRHPMVETISQSVESRPIPPYVAGIQPPCMGLKTFIQDIFNNLPSDAPSVTRYSLSWELTNFSKLAIYKIDNKSPNWLYLNNNITITPHSISRFYIDGQWFVKGFYTAKGTIPTSENHFALPNKLSPFSIELSLTHTCLSEDGYEAYHSQLSSNHENLLAKDNPDYQGREINIQTAEPSPSFEATFSINTSDMVYYNILYHNQIIENDNDSIQDTSDDAIMLCLFLPAPIRPASPSLTFLCPADWERTNCLSLTYPSNEIPVTTFCLYVSETNALLPCESPQRVPGAEKPPHGKVITLSDCG